jgi:ABC-type branched-subunit amino acid transport system permease subunit
MFALLKKFSFNAFWGWMGGRHFLLAAFFAITAFYLALHGLLTREYAGAMCAIQGFMTWRTTHEDKKEIAQQAQAQSQGQTQSDNTSNTTVINVEPAVGSDGAKG